MRALIVTNMWPSPAAPALGAFVRDQVEALRAVGGPDLELEVAAFPPGGYAARRARPAPPRARADVVHAHFGLTAWPALAARGAGAARHAPRHRRAPPALRAHHPRRPPVPGPRRDRERRASPPSSAGARRVAVLPCGVATDRFRPLPRAEARAQLGLDPDTPCLLFPADPARPGKRHDRAAEVAAGAGRAAADRRRRGPRRDAAVGQRRERRARALRPRGLRARRARGARLRRARARHAHRASTTSSCPGSTARCARRTTATAGPPRVAPHLAAADPRVAGRDRAELYGARPMARRVLEAWRELLGEAPATGMTTGAGR